MCVDLYFGLGLVFFRCGLGCINDETWGVR